MTASIGDRLGDVGDHHQQLVDIARTAADALSANWEVIDTIGPSGAIVDAQAEMLGILEHRGKLMQQELDSLKARVARLEPLTEDD